MNRYTLEEKSVKAAVQPSVQEVCSDVRTRLNMSTEVSDERVYACIDEIIMDISRERHMNLEYKLNLRERVFNSLRRLDVLQSLLEDEEVTEIMINSYDNIFVEKRGQLIRTELSFESISRYEDIVQQIVSGANRMVNQTTPIVDVRLKDGSRVNVILAPVAIDGTTMTIRKFSDKGWNMNKLVEKEALSHRMAQFFRILVCSRYNIIVSGSTGSGKTTLLNLLSEFIPDTERIVTIEDSAELNLRNIPNMVRLETKNANVEGEHEIKIWELIKASLRMRPDRIIVGEVRGEEAFFMINAAMNTGHDGSLSTCHANSCLDALARLETMVLMGCEMPLPAIRRQIGSAIDIVIQLGRMRDKSRKVLEVCEVTGIDADDIQLNPLFLFRETGEKDGRIEGEWDFINPIKRRTKLLQAGYDEAMRKLEEWRPDR
ncbi:MAG: CpaF family protein [Lachnospiraceae bacterium]|nr:CpaF family protein [Lachnospiraceae bacterium]